MSEQPEGLEPMEAPIPLKGPRKKTRARIPKKSDRADTSKAANAAKALQAQKQAELAKRREDDLKLDPEKYVWYLECQSCLGPGIWMFAPPGGPFPADKTEASYKPLGFDYPAREWHCQCCLPEEKHKLKTWVFPNGQVGPNPRYVRRITRAEYEELVGEEVTA